MPTATCESKLSCTAYFANDRAGDQRTKEVDGMLHLIEHVYDGSLGSFWCGVTELACSPDDVIADAAGFPTNLRIHLALEDGRRGIARFLLVHTRGGDDGRIVTRVKLFGMTDLVIPGHVKLWG